MTSFDVAYNKAILPTTGGYVQMSEEVKRRCSALTRGSTAMWVGIASQGEQGMRGRWNSKYKALGLNRIVAIYETSSDSFRKGMEKELTRFYGGILDNVNAGGGGGIGSPPYFVYVAWK